ncbi:SDR family oxidoreductase [Sphingomonas sp. CL5.1]|uniref:SDR family oxidoreductase n=1 Tax=Sphingomonas sp. CL5.1 TaxID=2653203 RepID=UPI00158443BA|nr:SDR family oxidoreductase [Sphingomonas sp. CL5.1]QKR99925.1 SDR family oxidoreductase [Sphingomonas sp. CL5.1]
MSYDIDLTGKRVLVVGGSSGIGKATAHLFARANAAVFVAARQSERLDCAAAKLGATPIALDTRDNAAVEAVFSDAQPFHHVIVSASQTEVGSVAHLPLDDAKAAMESKFWGAYRIARAARIEPSGSLTLVSGVLGVRPNAASVLLGAINAALEGLVRGLALEMAPIRVSAISPGTVDTPLWSGLPEEKRGALFAATANRLPVGRVGQPDDIAAAILFTAINGFVTGTTIRVDGGGTIA